MCIIRKCANVDFKLSGDITLHCMLARENLAGKTGENASFSRIITFISGLL